MKVQRTPDDRFSDLPGFPFSPHYAEIDDGEGGGALLRVHYVDEGPRDGPVVLLMHGEPSWSYLYRHMIPVLVAEGMRCVAPDLVGFGRSDKPASTSDYTYARHVAWMSSLVVDVLDLDGITLFCQDWGGLIGLRLVGAHPERFAAVAVSNTGLPDGHSRLSDAFLAWQKYSQEVPSLPVGRLIAGGCTTPLPADVIAAYEAPFPDDTYMAGARIFPTLAPGSPDDPAAIDNQAAWEVLERFEKPFLCLFGDSDPITRGGEKAFLRRVPGTEGQPHRTIEGGGHFVQEDQGPLLAGLVADLVRSAAQ